MEAIPGPPCAGGAGRLFGYTAPRELAQGLWQLGHHHYSLYLVRGQRGTALFEVGISAIADEVIRQLEMLDARPDYLIVSHPHADHLTGLGVLRERFPQARVVIGEGAAEFAAHPKAIEALVAEDRHMASVLEAGGHRPGRPPLEGPPSLAGFSVAKDGDRIDLGGVELAFLAAKGHSPGHLAVHVPGVGGGGGALLLSDALGFRCTEGWFWPMPYTSADDYLATLDRLEGLGSEVLGLGHQGPILPPDSRGAFAQARDALSRFTALIRGAQDTEALAQALFTKYYRGDLTINSAPNSRNCIALLIRRCGESQAGA